MKSVIDKTYNISETDLCIRNKCTSATLRIYMMRSSMSNVKVDYDSNGGRIYTNLTKENLDELSRLINRNGYRKSAKSKGKDKYLKEAYQLRTFTLNDYEIQNCPAAAKTVAGIFCNESNMFCRDIDDCLLKRITDICKKDRDFETNESTTDILKLLEFKEYI